jgi:hypothetical protein
MNNPLEILKKGLLQQNHLSSLSPLSFSPKRSNSTTVHHPFPKRFDYRVELLRERYLVSIHAIDKADIIHDFMYMPPVTPLNKTTGPSPDIEAEKIKQPADFKSSKPADLLVEYTSDTE